MARRLRWILVPLVLLLLVCAPAASPSSVLAGTPPVGAKAAGDWYPGATPPNPDPLKPVLLFVHGKGGSAASWWSNTAYHGMNDMYAYAYANGYRTAFVDLAPEGDMWANGALLRHQLDAITAHFGVERVVVIAHSKGGVDINAATAFYGAAPKVSKVITLGTPHWGTPVADLAYSAWTWWLAALLGQRTDATYVMQTGYMSWFRSQADASGDPVPYYTLSGYRCGPFNTALWWGCVYLAGEDDGLVPLASSHKPRATLVQDGWWDHDEIRMGSRTWSSFAPLLQGGGTQAHGTQSGAVPWDSARRCPSEGALANMIARGGEVEGKATGKPFPLEPGVRKASLSFYASSPDFTASLTGPDGTRYKVAVEQQVPVGELFAGAWVGAVELEQPASGTWTFETAAPVRTGYLMVASLESDLRAQLDVGQGVSLPGERRSLTVTLPGVQGATVSADLAAGGKEPYGTPAFTAAKGGVYRSAAVLDAAEGVHNVSLSVTGTLPDGSAFERSLVGSFAVVAKGAKAPWLGQTDRDE